MKSFWENRYKIAKILAAVGSVFGILFGLNVIGVIPMSNVVMTIVGFPWLICTLAAYLLGGLFNALKMSFSIAKWGWFLIPIFPIDLVVALVAGVVALIALLFIPIVPVMKAAKEAGA